MAQQHMNRREFGRLAGLPDRRLQTEFLDLVLGLSAFAVIAACADALIEPFNDMVTRRLCHVICAMFLAATGCHLR
jgi:hypothetical protein